MEQVFIDGTHIKANANSHKYEEQVFLKEARHYEKELQEEIKKDREAHGKKPHKEKEVLPEEGKRKVSTTDPDSGWFHKGEHKQVFAYSANTCCDKIIIFWTSQSLLEMFMTVPLSGNSING